MQNAFEQVIGKAANGFHQSDVPSLKGMTAVVTGGTGGIGFEVGRALALAQARVILLSRKGEHGDESISKIKNDSNAGPLADVTFIECDLGDLRNVKKVADQISKQEKRLDILVCDAGVGVNKFDVSSDGVDRHFAVNHLGHFLLVNRLLPLIRRTSDLPDTPPPRIVSVSSELHRAASSSVRFDSVQELNDMKNESVKGLLGEANTLYARSKLANILFIKGLVKRALVATGTPNIYALASHPGAVHTGQQDQFKEAYGGVFGTIMKAAVVPFMRNPDQGSLSTLWAATSEDVLKGGGKWQGKYVTDPAQDGNESELAKDEGLGDNLWMLSENIVKEKIGTDGLLAWNQSAAV